MFMMFERSTLIGRILRFPLDLIPGETEVRIVRGPLRGKKWVVGAGSHAYWTGTYEVSQLETFASAIKPGDCIYDVGANVGVYTLLACDRGGPKSKVFAFEPLERNLRYLRRHDALNCPKQCTVKELAVLDYVGTARFSVTPWDSSMSRVSSDGEITVSTITIDDSVFQKTEMPPPDVIKIDVEGAELRVLQGATRTLSEFHPKLFVEVHGVMEHSDCHEFLTAKGYRVEDEYGRITAAWIS